MTEHIYKQSHYSFMQLLASIQQKGMEVILCKIMFALQENHGISKLLHVNDGYISCVFNLYSTVCSIS